MQSTPRANAEPVLLVMSALAFLQILTAGSALGDVIGKDTAAFLVLLVAALQAGVQFYVRGQVTAVANVVAQVDSAGVVVAGPASALDDGHRVEVIPAFQ